MRSFKVTAQVIRMDKTTALTSPIPRPFEKTWLIEAYVVGEAKKKAYELAAEEELSIASGFSIEVEALN